MELTCAREAAATGSRPNSEKTSSTVLPSSFSIKARASTVGKVGMLSCRAANSAITGGGSTSGLHQHMGREFTCTCAPVAAANITGRETRLVPTDQASMPLKVDYMEVAQIEDQALPAPAGAAN